MALSIATNMLFHIGCDFSIARIDEEYKCAVNKEEYNPFLSFE
jgi:hypothetical protein